MLYLFQSSIGSIAAHHHYRYSGDYCFERHFISTRSVQSILLLKRCNIIIYYDTITNNQKFIIIRRSNQIVFCCRFFVVAFDYNITYYTIYVLGAYSKNCQTRLRPSSSHGSSGEKFVYYIITCTS